MPTIGQCPAGSGRREEAAGSSAMWEEPSTLVVMTHLRPLEGPRAELAVAYASRHGDIVAMVSRRGMLLVRRDLCPEWATGVRVCVSAGDAVEAVSERLASAHRVALQAGNGVVA